MRGMKECYQTVNESLLMSIGTAIIIAGTIFIQDSVFASQKNVAILEPIEIKGETTATTTNTKNIVLVHGSWGDGSIWSRVIPILQNAGLKVTAIQLPLESLADDIATVKRAIEHIGKPTNQLTFVEESGPPAWKQLPTWYQISENDRVVPPEYQHFVAGRMNATSLSLNASHFSQLSQPDEIAELILNATKGKR